MTFHSRQVIDVKTRNRTQEGPGRACEGGGGSDTIQDGGQKWKSPLPPHKHVTAPPYYFCIHLPNVCHCIPCFSCNCSTFDLGILMSVSFTFTIYTEIHSTSLSQSSNFVIPCKYATTFDNWTGIGLMQLGPPQSRYSYTALWYTWQRFDKKNELPKIPSILRPSAREIWCFTDVVEA